MISAAAGPRLLLPRTASRPPEGELAAAQTDVLEHVVVHPALRTSPHQAQLAAKARALLAPPGQDTEGLPQGSTARWVSDLRVEVK